MPNLLKSFKTEAGETSDPHYGKVITYILDTYMRTAQQLALRCGLPSLEERSERSGRAAPNNLIHAINHVLDITFIEAGQRNAPRF